MSKDLYWDKHTLWHWRCRKFDCWSPKSFYQHISQNRQLFMSNVCCADWFICLVVFFYLLRLFNFCLLNFFFIYVVLPHILHTFVPCSRYSDEGLGGGRRWEQARVTDRRTGRAQCTVVTGRDYGAFDIDAQTHTRVSVAWLPSHSARDRRHANLGHLPLPPRGIYE